MENKMLSGLGADPNIPLHIVELSNGLVVNSHSVALMRCEIIKILQKGEKPLDCSTCGLWRCKDCRKNQDVQYCSGCEVLQYDCFITGTRDEICTDLFQFTKILLEVL